MASVIWAFVITLGISALIHAVLEKVGVFDVDITAGFDAGDHSRNSVATDACPAQTE